MAEQQPNSVQLTWMQLLILLVIGTAGACLVWEPMDVLSVVGFALTYLFISILLMLLHKALLWVPALLLGFGLVFFNEILWEIVVPWGAAIGGICLLIALLWVLLTTRGRAWWLDWRGMMAMRHGKYDKAESLLRRSMELREARYGTEHRSIGWSHTLFASLAHEKGDLEQLRQHAQHALDLQERLLPKEHSEIRQSLNLLAAAQIGQGRFTEATEIYHRLLAVAPAKPGMARLERAIFLHNLALCHMEHGRFVQAEDLCRQSADLMKQEPYLKLWGCNAYLRSLTAELCLRQQRPHEAWRVATEAVSLIEKQVAPYQIYRTVPMLRLARAGLVTNRPGESLEIMREVVRVQEAFFGPDHHFLVGSLLLRGQAHAQLNRIPEAEADFRRALTIGEKKLPVHPRLGEILDAWGWMFLQHNKLTEAGPLLRRALEHRRRFLPGSHPDLVTSLSHYAAFHHQNGNEAEAQRLAAESVQVSQEPAEGPPAFPLDSSAAVAPKGTHHHAY